MEKSTEKYAKDLADLMTDKSFVVFLCGPSLEDENAEGSKLRKWLKGALEAEGFDVVLGEDDGLEEPRLRHHIYAHLNEMWFIENGYCNAVVLIASSVGAYCELGLFSYKKALSKNKHPDFILIISDRYRDKKSFLNLGPALAIKDNGVVYYADLESFDGKEVINRLKRHRTAYFMDRKGRRPGRIKSK